MSIWNTGILHVFLKEVNMFSAILKDLRVKKGISQTKLAKEIGVSAGNISDWESDRSKPGYLALISLARFFEVSADYLLELQPSPNGTLPVKCLNVPLDGVEIDLVEAFRFISVDDQSELLELAFSKYQETLDHKRKYAHSSYQDETNHTETA